MPLILSDEARLVREGALEFFRERSPIVAFRKLRDSQDPDGFSRPLWRQMAELGWTGFLVDEANGGSGFGMVGLGQVMEAAGRTLAATPLLSTAVIGASALTLAHRTALIPGLLAGDTLFALAAEEGPHHAPDRVATTARHEGGGWAIDGAKSFVLDGHVADQLLVTARGADGVGLFLVPAKSPGIEITRLSMVDSRNAARIRLTGVVVPDDSLLGGANLLEALLDRARAALAAEMLGAASEAFERTVQYLKDRKQFGVPIGSFQALKHRAAHLFGEIEITRSAVLAALTALDEQTPDAAAVVSLAKAKANETLHLASNEGVQMHGGIGMTDEHEIGFFMKRARVAEASFGSTAFHRGRYADLMGF
jgi:alkylation response protein AidB-like acyl-CoA dehydrogenase